MSGPRPTPTPILAARGSWLVGKRKCEPAAQGKPAPIFKLTKRAKTIWDFTARELDRMGVGKTIDSAALYRYAKMFALWLDASDQLAKQPLMSKSINKRGAEYAEINPLIRVVAQYDQRLLKMEQEFGMTPSARTRIQAEVSPGPPQPKARFFEKTG